MGPRPHRQYCTALPKDIIHSGPPGQRSGIGEKNVPLKGGHALYLLIRANDCILQTGNQENNTNSCKSILGKNMCLSIESLGGNLSMFLNVFNMGPFVPSLPLFRFSHSLFIPFHAFIFLFVQYLQYCAQLCTEWGRSSRCVAWVNSPLGGDWKCLWGAGHLVFGGLG